MAEIANPADAFVHPLQQNEIGGLARRIVRIASDQRRAQVDEAGYEVPVVHAGVVVKIALDLGAPSHTSLDYELQSHVFRQHVAQGLSVARIAEVNTRR